MALPTTIHHLLVIVVLPLALIVTAGCSSTPTPGSGATPPFTRFRFDARQFVDPTLSTNPYHPLRPGMQWVRSGTTEVGHRKVPHSVTSTMTDVTRMIDGVPVIAMLDESTDSGEVSEVGFDYFALDKDGNVWIMGGYTEDFQAGEFTNAGDAWLGRASGGLPGVLVFMLLAGMWGLVFTGFPYAIALRTGNPAAVNSSFLLFFPFVFLTTAYLPKEALTGWLAAVATVNPVTYMLAAMRSLILVGWDTTAIGQALLAIFLMGAVSMPLAFAALRGRLKRG